MAANTTSLIQNRPYRSHRVPACTRCRSRKIRCQIDIPNEPCLSCRERRLKCQYIDTPSSATGSPENGERRLSKRPRLSITGADGEISIRPRAAPVLHKEATNPSASIILTPHMAEDVDILQRHISRHQPSGGKGPETYQLLYSDASNPVVYQSVPRFRVGLRPEMGAGKEQLEIIEQILGPFKREVIDLYFQHIHHHFPILDDQTCSEARKGLVEDMAWNLVCVLYAIGMWNWKKSDALKLHPRPDSHYVWNKAISAVLEDFLSPNIYTISAAVLDQIGRPSVSIVGNITLCGRTVSLAQTFGLHRDPSRWAIPDHEKLTRIRIWWGVLVTDSWASISYGAPPHIAKGYYDVPMLTPESLFPAKATIEQKYAATCFVHLCGLTELLGDILPLVYHVGPNPEQLTKEVQRLQKVLNHLESQLPEWLPLPQRTGTSNLWFCFLSMRLLLNRVALRAAILTGDKSLQDARFDELCSSAAAVLDFILYLGEYQFLDFWLPHVAHLLVLAVMVSLRCTVEARNAEDRASSISRLQRLLAHIQHARDNYDWDLANYCIERCSDSILKIAALAATEPPQPDKNEVPQAAVAEDPAVVPAFEEPSFLLSDILDPNAFDFSWEALWDTPSGMPNFCTD